MSFLMVTNEQMAILYFASLPLTVFPSALGFPAQWHIMWLTMCLCHHSAWGKTHPVYHGLLARVQPSIQPVYFFQFALFPDCHNIRKHGQRHATQTFLVHPHKEQGGNPQYVVYLVLTRLSIRILPKAFSPWKQGELGWNLTQLGNAWGLHRSGMT